MKKIRGLWPVAIWLSVFCFLALSSLWWGLWMLAGAACFFVATLVVGAKFLKKERLSKCKSIVEMMGVSDFRHIPAKIISKKLVGTYDYSSETTTEPVNAAGNDTKQGG